MIAHSLCVLWVVLVFGREVCAAPETWFDPVLTETGNTSSAFGSSVACSSVPTGGYYSFVAVGAPEESSGDGRVHILNPDGLVQTIAAPVTRAGNFGYFVAFIPDINSDFTDELVVGEPNSSGLSGYAHVFLSTGDISAPYDSTPCATQSGPASFGSYIHANSTSSVVISAPMFSTPSINSYGITYGGPSSCSFVFSSGYDSSGSLGSRYGQSFAEIDTGGPGVVVGAPGLSSDAGGIYKEETSATATLEYSGSAGSNMGAAVAARYSSPVLAYSSPFGSGSVTVQGYTQGAFAGFFDVCGLSVPMSDVPPTAGQSLTHLGVEFKDFVGTSVSGAVFGVYSTQASTGGSIALFGADMPVTCTERYSINNCAFDPDQKQGVAIAGGPQCKTTGGSSIIVVGSPGYNGNSGRIDVYQEGTHLASARPCSEATSTPTPTPTFTATPAQGVVDTPIPVDPTTSGLPAPEASVSGNSVTITAPQGVPSARLQQLIEKRLRRWCRKRGKRCRYRASISYQFIVTGPSGASKKMTSFEFDALSKKAKRRQYNSRKNSITLRKLKPGSYTASYRFVFTVKDPKARLTGRLSAGSRFVVR